MAPEELLAVQRQRVHDLVSVLDARSVRTPVLACPGWSVHDLVAHLVGSAADLAEGRVDGARTDARNARQVGERQAASLDELWAEWERHGAVLEASPDTWAPLGMWLLYDTVIHEDDLREAVAADPASDSPAYPVLLEGLVSTADRTLRHAGVQALRIVADDGQGWTVGPGPAAASVRAGTHDLVRGLSGRLGVQAMASWDWEGDAGPYLPLLPALP